MSAITHDDDKTTLDVISDSLNSKQMMGQEKREKKTKKKSPKTKKVVSDAEMEANNLAQSLKNHRLFENHQL